MRIVAGKYRGRRLNAPEGRDTRPTSDRAREALFNILAGGRYSAGVSPIPGAQVLDAFAGTGALGLEALSRGAEHIFFIEQAAPALQALRANIKALAAQAACRLLASDVLHPPPSPRGPMDLVLLDPPYDKGLLTPALAALADKGWIGARTLVVAEVMQREETVLPEGFTLLEARRYGKAKLLLSRLG